MTLLPYQIRPVAPDDIPLLIAFRRAMFEDMGVRDTTALDAMDAACTEYFAEALPRGEFRAWVAVADNAVVASGGLVIYAVPPSVRNLSGRVGYIMSMYTLLKWRGQGIATAILQTILDHLRAQGVGMATLHASTAGRPIYEREGFEPSNEMRLRL
ncbi:MAG: GNAT family N-acetyltransferase [Chloroflexi bacterium]|nr:GNAT family N-acetyltransferase [Chloroflexota bacterium]